MSSISAKLDRLEARLQTLIEGRLTRLLPAQEYREKLISHLVSALNAGIQHQPDGSSLAPDVYVLLVHPDISPKIETNQPLLEELAVFIQKAGLDAGLIFAQPPLIYVSPNSEVAENSIVVLTRISREPLGQTIESIIQDETGAGNIPQNAFLIVNGIEIFVLDQAVVNIGRHSNNDLVIEDTRVSRSHAQLRADHGRYVLFDLGSKGGTFVNGKRVVRMQINPKDVISLAGLPLVYGQDVLNSDSLEQTQQMNPSSLVSSVDEEASTKDNRL